MCTAVVLCHAYLNIYHAAAASAVRLKKLLSADRAPGAASPSSSGGQLRPSLWHAARMSAGSGAWIRSGSPVAGCLT